MFAEGSVDDADVEEDLAGVVDLAELCNGVFKLVVVVARQGAYPGFDFLCEADGK